MIIVFDMGATRTRIAVSPDGQALDEPEIFATDQNFDTGIQTLAQNIEKVSKGQHISLIVGGVPSVLNQDHSEIVISNNLPKWINQPFKKVLSDRLNASVRLLNDAELIALGEAIVGAGRDKKIVGYITISTGVGGVRVVDSSVDPSAQGFEIGYQYIANKKGGLMSLEQAVGGNSLQKRYHKTPKELAKDQSIWSEVIHNFAVGIHNAIIFWSPEVVVLGGSMMHDIPLQQIKQELRGLLHAYPALPELRLAELGDKGGLYGALALASITDSISFDK